MASPNLIDKLDRTLPRAARDVLAALVRAAQAQSLHLYLVGGALRDLLLGRPTLDLDLTLEGDAPALARHVAASSDVRCVVHPAFGTATLKGAGFSLDVATARAETYPRPGALPTVRPGSLRDDLLRRDFTVNAIALALTEERRGRIVDPFRGRADLRARLLRVLHERSFRDDATRVLRAARYESRLGFRLERRTLRWLRRDVSYLEAISGARVREEMSRILREPQPERVLLRLEALGALRVLHPALTFGGRRGRAFARLREARPDPPVTAYLALLAWDLTREQAAALAARLALTRREREAVIAVPEVRALEPALPAARPSGVTEALAPFPSPAAWALAAAGRKPAREAALRYLRRWRHVRPALDGHDLQALGAGPGPRLGEVLRRLKAAKLDGEVRSRRDEERLARRLLGLPTGHSRHQKAGLQPGRPPRS